MVARTSSATRCPPAPPPTAAPTNETRAGRIVGRAIPFRAAEAARNGSRSPARPARGDPKGGTPMPKTVSAPRARLTATRTRSSKPITRWAVLAGVAGLAVIALGFGLLASSGGRSARSTAGGGPALCPGAGQSGVAGLAVLALGVGLLAPPGGRSARSTAVSVAAISPRSMTTVITVDGTGVPVREPELFLYQDKYAPFRH